MSKDTIFSNEPKAKVYPNYVSRSYKPADASRPYVGAMSNRSYLHTIPKEIICKKDELNLNNYRKVKKDEILLKDDIYLDDGFCGWRYTQLAGQTPCTKTYYRKVSFNTPPYIDIREYRLLFPSDFIQDGDEFFNKGKWFKSGNIGKAADIYFYRRKLPLIDLTQD